MRRLRKYALLQAKQDIEKATYEFAKSEVFVKNIVKLLPNTIISKDKDDAKCEKYENTISLKKKLLTNQQLLEFITSISEGRKLIDVINDLPDSVLHEPLLANYISKLMTVYKKEYPKYFVANNSKTEFTVDIDDVKNVYPYFLDDFQKHFSFSAFDYDEEYIEEILFSLYDLQELLDYALQQKRNPDKYSILKDLPDDGNSVLNYYYDEMAYECQDDLNDYVNNNMTKLGFEFYPNLDVEQIKELLNNEKINYEIEKHLANKIDFKHFLSAIEEELDERDEYDDTFDENVGVQHIKQLLNIEDSVGDHIKMTTHFDVDNRDYPFTVVYNQQLDDSFVIWGERKSMHGESLAEYMPSIKNDGEKRPSDETIEQYKPEWTGFGFGHYGNKVAVIEKCTLNSLTTDEAKEIILNNTQKPIEKIYVAPGHGKSGDLIRTY